MITCFFGVPRVGKNTLLTMIALQELKKMKQGKSKYKHIYTDFFVEGCEFIDYRVFKHWKMYDSLVLIEEMGLDADGREHKSFTRAERDFFVLHGHIHCDIIYATQDYSNVDKKIRDLTEELWYLSKSCVPVVKHFTFAKRIFRTIAINEHTSELVNGYRFSTFLERIFTKCTKICFRPLYYSKFDSYDEGSLESRPIFESAKWGDKESISVVVAQLNQLEKRKVA